ncbi:MAG: 50S ribosomal protein L3 N(5)-glutamine methyltransferase, partial [Steroidobacteraceae bacterium]|nr:50S ribosomal protein L3 N(5)-glutamine methyltransferase [Steroidobacteraceae bacterium]MDW8260104.1 50S ribosomal protein L3 N(5)-glutamine methyltransferase [Gammaproteobacteria bacterium]
MNIATLSHGVRPLRSARCRATAAELLVSAARQLRRARVHFGHGTDNATDEAAMLVYHALQLKWQWPPERALARRATPAQQRRLAVLLDKRIRERTPAAYLTGETFFAGLPFFIDRRALVPRSPFAELIATQFAPWIDLRRVRRVLDIGTGSGCIALAMARYFPWLRLDAVDISADALELARRNRRRHRLTRRVRLIRSDVYAALGTRRYDMIVANPPYVGAREYARLPAEYRHEPPLGLRGGRDGLAVVRRIVAGAAAHLRPGGVLIVEVGDSERAVRRAWPQVPFTWLEFARGGG